MTMKSSMTTRTPESYEKFLKNVWKLQNNGKFVSEYNYKKLIMQSAEVLRLPEYYFLNAQISQLEKWELEMNEKPLFHKNPKKYRSDIKSSFKAYIAYCKFQKGLISF